MAKKTRRNKKRKAGNEALLLQLPQEMRNEIYAHLFFSTRLASGLRSITPQRSQRITSRSHTLALLRTCRQVYTEIGTSWLQQVLFSFETLSAMLDKLTNIPTATRALIRYVRVCGEPFYFDDVCITYHVCQALTLLPGLALERLTVLGPRTREERYKTLDELVRRGAGWRELYYLSYDSTFLAYKHEWFNHNGLYSKEYLRAPQPAGWRQTLAARDGRASGASVVVYRATESSRDCPNGVLHPATRAVYAQDVPPARDLPTFGKAEDAELMARGERDKEVLVVVTRGRDVDYVQRAWAPYVEHDIRRALAGKTWTQMKAEICRRNADGRQPEPVHPFAFLDTGTYGRQIHPFFGDEAEGDGQRPAEVDYYTDVEEYVWPPVYF
ncbi:hypothetical protein C8R46DRAFT_1093566 [Mycena filopes]|nr:hypothetical protein C8R46DRAFT_1093566 [Mycena filopes]